MPQITGYEDRIAAQGGLNVRANPDDFGAQVGAGLGRLAAGASDFGEAAFKQAEIQDATKAHVEMAKARPEWSKTLEERANSSAPGDDTLAPKLVEDIGTWAGKAAEGAATPAGKRLYLTLGANLASEFGQRAVAIQSELAAKEAVNQNEELARTLGDSAFADPSQAPAAIAQAMATYDDPNTIFARIPEPARKALKLQAQQKISFAALSGVVRDRPMEFLGLVKPEELQQFKPFEKLLKASEVEGGRVDISPATMAKAPTITQPAAAHGVVPGVAMAQADLDPTADPVKTAADMGKLLSKFGGSYELALGAYQMGTLKLGEITERFGNSWQANLPSETKDYINSVLTKSGMLPVENPPANAEQTDAVPTSPRAPVQVPGSPLMNNLSWEQQDHLFGEAVRLAHVKLGMAERARAEEKYQREQEQEKIRMGYEQSIFRPQEYGRFDSQKMWADTTLDSAHKEHLQNTFDRRIRELQSDHESKQHPEEVRRLDGMINAAADDPTKTFNFKPVQDAYQNGRISFMERNQLWDVYQRSKGSDGAGFNQRLKVLQEAKYTAFTRSLEGSIQPDKAVNAYYSWWVDSQAKISAKLAKGEDPSVLLDPKSKEFIGNTVGFMPGATDTLATGAAKAKAIAPGTVRDGYRFKGGDPAKQSNWEKVAETPAPASYEENA